MGGKQSDALAIATQQFEESVGNIRLIAELLSRQSDSLPIRRRQEYLGTMAATAANLGKLVLDLMQIRSLDASEQALHCTELCVSEVIMQAMEAVSSEAEKKGMQVILSSVENEPNLLADYPKLSQVFTGILERAIHVSRPGERVQIEVVPFASNVRVTLHRTAASGGCRGLQPAEYAPLNSRVSDGSVGVALAKELVKLHGGVFSQSPCERMFLVMLPRNPEESKLVNP